MTSSPLIGSIRLPDGSWIRGRALRRRTPAEPWPEFGLYLGSDRLRRRHEAELSWPCVWIEWPDFSLPRDRDHAVRHIRVLHDQAQAGRMVEVACGGGIGRTGTVIACLAVLAGLPSADAITWTRANYHRRAIETPWQRTFVSVMTMGDRGM